MDQEMTGSSGVSHETLKLFPILSLDISTPPPVSELIQAKVALVYPYSSATDSAGLLAAEPDFRLRRRGGQVHIRFEGAAAKAVGSARIGIGDTIRLSLEGATWVEDENASKNPGRNIGAALSFRRKLKLEHSSDGFAFKTLVVDEPEVEPQAEAATPPASPKTYTHATPLASTARSQWSSPAFLRQRPGTEQPLLGPVLYPYAVDDLDLDDRPRKKTRFGRSSGGWKFSQQPPSPHEEPSSWIAPPSSPAKAAPAEEGLAVPSIGDLSDHVMANVDQDIEEDPLPPNTSATSETPVVEAQQLDDGLAEPEVHGPRSDPRPVVEAMPAVDIGMDISVADIGVQLAPPDTVSIRQLNDIDLPEGRHRTPTPSSPVTVSMADQDAQMPGQAIPLDRIDTSVTTVEDSGLVEHPLTPRSPVLEPVDSALLSLVSPFPTTTRPSNFGSWSTTQAHNAIESHRETNPAMDMLTSIGNQLSNDPLQAPFARNDLSPYGLDGSSESRLQLNHIDRVPISFESVARIAKEISSTRDLEEQALQALAAPKDSETLQQKSDESTDDIMSEPSPPSIRSARHDNIAALYRTDAEEEEAEMVSRGSMTKAELAAYESLQSKVGSKSDEGVADNGHVAHKREEASTTVEATNNGSVHSEPVELSLSSAEVGDLMLPGNVSLALKEPSLGTDLGAEFVDLVSSASEDSYAEFEQTKTGLVAKAQLGSSGSVAKTAVDALVKELQDFQEEFTSTVGTVAIASKHERTEITSNTITEDKQTPLPIEIGAASQHSPATSSWKPESAQQADKTELVELSQVVVAASEAIHEDSGKDKSEVPDVMEVESSIQQHHTPPQPLSLEESVVDFDEQDLAVRRQIMLEMGAAFSKAYTSSDNPSATNETLRPSLDDRAILKGSDLSSSGKLPDVVTASAESTTRLGILSSTDGFDEVSTDTAGLMFNTIDTQEQGVLHPDSTASVEPPLLSSATFQITPDNLEETMAVPTLNPFSSAAADYNQPTAHTQSPNAGSTRSQYFHEAEVDGEQQSESEITRPSLDVVDDAMDTVTSPNNIVEHGQSGEHLSLPDGIADDFDVESSLEDRGEELQSRESKAKAGTAVEHLYTEEPMIDVGEPPPDEQLQVTASLRDNSITRGTGTATSIFEEDADSVVLAGSSPWPAEDLKILDAPAIPFHQSHFETESLQRQPKEHELEAGHYERERTPEPITTTSSVHRREFDMTDNDQPMPTLDETGTVLYTGTKSTTTKAMRTAIIDENDSLPAPTQTDVAQQALQTPVPAPRRMSARLRKSDVPEVLSGWFESRRKSVRHPPKETLDEDLIEDVAPTSDDAVTRSVVSASAPLTGKVASAVEPQAKNAKSLSAATASVADAATLFAEGFQTPLSYYQPLASLNKFLNELPATGETTIDVLAVVTWQSKKPLKAKGGPKDYYTMLHVKESSKLDGETEVQIFRPSKDYLPVADKGDIVLLRNFLVKSRKRECYLLSGESSAWHVWHFGHALRDQKQGDKPVWASKKDEIDSAAVEESRGAPVELGEEEQSHARYLRKWWEDMQSHK